MTDFINVTANPVNHSHFINTSASSGFTEEEVRLLTTLNYIKNIFIPIIAALGLFGNTISLIVFTHRNMRKLSVSVFLASLAVVDNVFLVSLIVTWIDAQFSPILTTSWSCKLVIFITYVTSFLSVWFIVGFTVERFVAICFPLKIFFCSLFRQKMAIFSLVLTAFALYSHAFWTVTVYHNGTRGVCAYEPTYMDFMEKVTWVDTMITMVLPFLAITIINSKVLHSAIKGSAARRGKYTTIEHLCKSALGHVGQIITQKSARKEHNTFRVTRTLLLVSTTFLVLNLPSHTMRLYNLISAISPENHVFTVSVKFAVLQKIAMLLYYATFSCNFIIYTLFGRNFKQSLKSIFLCRSRRDEQREIFLKRPGSKRDGNNTITSTV